MDQQEIILVCNYKGFNVGRHYEFVTQVDRKVVSGVLSSLSDQIEQKAFDLSGIDTSKADEIVNRCSDIVSGVKSTKREALLPIAKNDKLMLPIAESYFLSKLFKKFGIKTKPVPDTSTKFKEEKSNDIMFIGNVKPWFMVKKMMPEGKADYEVSGILSAINFSIVNKSFEFLDLKREGDLFTCGLGARKSFGNLSEALSKLHELLKAGNYDSNTLACAYGQTCANVGFNKGVPGYMPYANAFVMQDKYPDIKIQKPKGRIGK